MINDWLQKAKSKNIDEAKIANLPPPSASSASSASSAPPAPPAPPYENRSEERYQKSKII